MNKAIPLIADDEKIKKAVPDFEITVDLNEGMKRTICNLKKEFDTINADVSEYFNFSCDKVIYLTDIKIEGKKRMSSKDYINGVKTETLIGKKFL